MGFQCPHLWGAENTEFHFTAVFQVPLQRRLMQWKKYESRPAHAPTPMTPVLKTLIPYMPNAKAMHRSKTCAVLAM
jgi:hypothetical protein